MVTHPWGVECFALLSKSGLSPWIIRKICTEICVFFPMYLFSHWFIYQCGLIDIYFTFGQFIWALFFISFKIKFNLISKSLFGGIAVVQVLSHVRLFMTSWTAAHKASLSFTISHNLLKLMSIESVMPSDHLILYRPLLLLSYFLSIKIFSNESAFGIR